MVAATLFAYEPTNLKTTVQTNNIDIVSTVFISVVGEWCELPSNVRSRGSFRRALARWSRPLNSQYTAAGLPISSPKNFFSLTPIIKLALIKREFVIGMLYNIPISTQNIQWRSPVSHLEHLPFSKPHNMN